MRMSNYEFETIWEFSASLAAVWAEIEDADSWPIWWKGVLSSVEIEPGDENGVGSIRRTVWKSALPYKLTFDSEVIRVEKHALIEARANGDLTGTGIWRFEEVESSKTRVIYDWRVTTDKAWMNKIAPLARPFFKWNHDVIMRWGQNGLRRRLMNKAVV